MFLNNCDISLFAEKYTSHHIDVVLFDYIHGVFSLGLTSSKVECSVCFLWRPIYVKYIRSKEMKLDRWWEVVLCDHTHL
jgi:hypothetical protein